MQGCEPHPSNSMCFCTAMSLHVLLHTDRIACAAAQRLAPEWHDSSCDLLGAPSHIALGSLATVHPHLYPAWEQAQLKLIALAHCTSKTICEHWLTAEPATNSA